jgi:hypothetical protein
MEEEVLILLQYGNENGVGTWWGVWTATQKELVSKFWDENQCWDDRTF